MPHIECLVRGLFTRNDSILICRDLKHGHAYLPGGHIEFGESAEEALQRELLEEAGLPCRIGAPLLFWEARFAQSGVPKHELTVVFRVEHPDKKQWPNAIPALEKHIAFEWITRRDSASAGLLPHTVAVWIENGPLAPAELQWLSIDEFSSTRPE